MSFFAYIAHAIAGAVIGMGALFGFGAHTQAPMQPPTQVHDTAQGTTTAAENTAHAFQGGQKSQQQPSAQTLHNPQSALSATHSAAIQLPDGSPWQTTLPLGDGKYVTSGPKKGYIYICHLVTGGHGAEGHATWINGDTWVPSQKVSVEGSVAWPSASYSMTLTGSTRHIVANGLPTDHNSGTFPIQRSDPAYQFDANPNSIKTQSYSFSLPAAPTAAATPGCIFGQVGIMNDGVPLFDGFDAEYRDAVAHETQDAWEAHPDEAGVYHYHGFESGYLKEPVSQVVGFAFDGYPITGGKLQSGNYLTSSDLDECHGITSTIELDGKKVTMYHYVLTQDFPYSVSCFHGTSYEPKPGKGGSSSSGQNPSAQTQGAQGGQSQPGEPPQGALDACSGKTSGSSCSFSTPNGTINGTCRMPPNQSSLACVPN